MSFTLPRLTTDIDCAPIGYPGLMVTCWLNPTFTDYEFPWESVEGDAGQAEARESIIRAEPWKAELYYMYGRWIERITFPAQMTDGTQPETVELPDAKAVWRLMTTPGFEQNIIIWVARQYSAQRQERLEAELKN